MDTMVESFLNGQVTATVGDITKESTDAVVNAANWTLLGGGGVDRAIHGAGGPAVLEECKWFRENIYPNGLPVGEVAITTAGRMPSKYVIHTVGPIYGANGGRDAELLSACYRNCLFAAISKDLRSIAFPAISTGAYGYPRHEAARGASRTIGQFLTELPGSIDVRMVFVGSGEYASFLKHADFTWNT